VVDVVGRVTRCGSDHLSLSGGHDGATFGNETHVAILRDWALLLVRWFSWTSLKRYTHIRQSADKYENWKWKARLAAE
jgi:hypothetical protein